MGLNKTCVINMMELLWKLGILSVVMVFGIKIGLAMGFAGLSKKVTAAIILGYGGGILLLTFIASGFIEQIQGFVYSYSSVLGIAMAAIILYAGFHTLKEWKINNKNSVTATCMAMIAPCPCCFGAAVAAIIIAAPIIGASTFAIGEYAAVFLMVVMTGCYLASGLIGRALKKPYPVLLGNFMLFAGFYFLTSAIVIPNISSVLSQQMNPLAIPDFWMFVYAIITLIVLMVAGFYLTRNRSPLLNN
jgi:predicted transporter